MMVMKAAEAEPQVAAGALVHVGDGGVERIGADLESPHILRLGDVLAVGVIGLVEELEPLYAVGGSEVKGVEVNAAPVGPATVPVGAAIGAIKGNGAGVVVELNQRRDVILIISESEKRWPRVPGGGGPRSATMMRVRGRVPSGDRRAVGRAAD